MLDKHAILDTRLRRSEGKTLEFKRDLSSPDGLLRTVVAFANTAGGTVLVGADTWTHESGTFVATAVTSVLKLANSQAGQQITFIDNVAVNAVPEPMPLSLFVLGIGVVWMRRRAA